MRLKLLFLFSITLIFMACQQQHAHKPDSPKKDSLKSDPVLDYFKSKEPNRKALEEEAKKRGIPFRKEENGVIYELHSFDEHTGMPIYYTTKAEQPTPTISPDRK